MIELSVVIPIYKVEKYIRELLDSIIFQSEFLNRIEFIFVDDGSPDKSIEIVKQKIHAFDNVRIIEQKNSGLSVARNNGYEIAQGKYVWFVDSDDKLLPHAFQLLFEVMSDNPKADVFATFLEVYDESGRLGTYHEKWKKINVNTGKDYLKMNYPQGAIQRFIFKKDFLQNNNLFFYPGILHEDDLFGFQMLYLANKVVILNQPIYIYRINRNGSIMQKRTMRTPQSLIFIHKELKKFMDEKVRTDDKPMFQYRIHNEIKNFFSFCYSLFDNKEYLAYYVSQKNYIRNESMFLLKNPRTFFYGIRIMFFPIFYLKIEKVLKKLYHYIKER